MHHHRIWKRNVGRVDNISAIEVDFSDLMTTTMTISMTESVTKAYPRMITSYFILEKLKKS